MTDLGTVLALGLVFAYYDLWLILFVVATLQTLGTRVSEPQTQFVALVLLGGLASIAGSEAVLPAYLVSMVLAPTFLRDRDCRTYFDAVLLLEGRLSG